MSNNFNKIQSQQNYKNESISENDNKKRKSNIDSKSKICLQENRFNYTSKKNKLGKNKRKSKKNSKILNDNNAESQIQKLKVEK